MIGRAMLVLLTLALGCASARADKLYKWVDDDGVVHYGDSVPADFAKAERFVLNEQGVVVDRMGRELSAEERALIVRQRELDAEREAEARRQKERDRILLATYLSVGEIEMLRDRRLLTLDAQIEVSEHHLRNLRERLLSLEEQAREYNYPFDPASAKEPLPDELAQDLYDAASAVSSREADLENTRHEQAVMRLRFQEEIERFLQLNATLEKP